MPLEKDFLLHNRYRILETIAVGGMGAIYRANDETLNISVAVKENFFTSEEFSRQFRREATILASLRHPNLPRVTDHFVIPNQGQYLVMDFIEGADLREQMAQKGALAQEEVLRVGLVICDALIYLHSRTPPIVHRDIKPGNIKITPAGQVYLVDFGLAKIARGESTTTGAQALTPGYAPPEQYGQGTETRSDIYSLGATLYAALAGQVPTDGLSRMMGSAELVPLRRLNTNVSEAAARAIEHAMAISPAERFSDARAFQKALAAVSADSKTSGQSITGTRPTAPPAASAARTAPLEAPPQMVKPTMPAPNAPPVTSTARRKKFPLGAVLGISLLVLLGGAAAFAYAAQLPPFYIPANPAASLPTVTAVLGASTVQASPTAQPSPEPSLTPSPPPTHTQAPTRTPAPSATPQPSTPTVTPIGGLPGQIAYASDQGGVPQIWLVNSDGTGSQQVTRLADGACQPDWSPDGKQLVFTSPCSGEKDEYPGASLYIINADGTGLRMLDSMPGGDFDPAWSPDGAQIAFTSLRDSIPHIYLYTLADDSVRRISSPVTHERRPAWSPDGTIIAYQTTRLGQSQIWMMARDGSKAQEFSTLAGAYDAMPAWSPDGEIIVFSRGSQPLLIARQVNNRQAKQFPVSDQIRPVKDARFSPDGFWLAFTGMKDGSSELFLISRNGGNLTTLTSGPGQDFHPAWRSTSLP